MSGQDDDKEWITIPVAPKVATKGIKCGECGRKFEHGKAYGTDCDNHPCPIFPRYK